MFNRILMRYYKWLSDYHRKKSNIHAQKAKLAYARMHGRKIKNMDKYKAKLANGK